MSNLIIPVSAARIVFRRASSFNNAFGLSAPEAKALLGFLGKAEEQGVFGRMESARARLAFAMRGLELAWLAMTVYVVGFVGDAFAGGLVSGCLGAAAGISAVGLLGFAALKSVVKLGRRKDKVVRALGRATDWRGRTKMVADRHAAFFLSEKERELLSGAACGESGAFAVAGSPRRL